MQSHSVEFDGLSKLAKLEVNVSHVDFEPPCIVEHSVFSDDL